MKKSLAIALIAIIILTPAVAFSHGNTSLLNDYSSNDSILTNNIEKYNDLLENSEDKIEMYENMRTKRKNSFYTAQAMASKENGLAQVTYDIENAYNLIKSRESLLEINFRKSYLNLYKQKIAYEDAWISYTEAKVDYDSAKSSHSAGYISKNSLLSAEYNSKSSHNIFLLKKRQYESALRQFNFDIGYPLDYNEFDYKFDEEIIEMQDPHIYLDSAKINSPAIISNEQLLSRYYIEATHYNTYSLLGNISYIKEALKLLEINTRLAELEGDKLKITIKENITVSYNNLIIEFMHLALENYNLEILNYNYEVNRSLYNTGYIDKEELSNSQESYSDAQRDYKLSVFEYNTNLKELEYDCAFYTEESDGK